MSGVRAVNNTTCGSTSLKYHTLRPSQFLIDTILAVQLAMWAEDFNSLTPDIKEQIDSPILSPDFSYESTGEKLLKYQDNSPWVTGRG